MLRGSVGGKTGMPPLPAEVKLAFPESTDTADLSGVLAKLLFFTLAMIVCPIGSYYLSLEYVWGLKNTTGAALTAAITANLVLVGFVWVAMAEDRADAKREKEKKKQ